MRSITADLAHILNQLDLLAAIIDDDFNIIMINDKLKEFFGDVVGKECYRVFYSTDSPPEYCAIMNLLRGGKGEEEFYEPSSDKWLRVRVSRLNVDGSTMFLHFVEDFTERKKHEEELNERESSFRALAENSIAGVFIYQDDYFVYCNSTCEKLTGYAKEEVIKMYFWDLFHPNHKNIIMEVGRKIQRGEIIEPVTYELPYYTKDRESRWGLFSFSRTIYHGKPAGVAIFFDITEKKGIEDELIEEMGRSLFEFTKDIIYIFSPDLKIIDVNPAIETLGYSRKEVIGKHIYDLLTQESKQKYAEKLSEFLEKGYIHHEVEVISKDGKPIPMDCIASAVYDKDGNVKFVVSIHRDISKQKEMEERLKDSEMLYRTLVEKTHDAVYILSPEGFLFVNDRVCEITGYTKEELYRIDPLSLIHPEDRDRVRNYMTKRFAGEYAPESHISRVVTKNGDTSFCEFSVKPIMYKGKRVVLGSVRDITERKLMEDRLRESEKRYRTLVETINDVVFLLDAEGRFKYLNKKFEEITGYPVEEMLGKHFTEVLAPEYVESTVEKFKKGLAGEEIPLYEVEVIKSDGERIPVELNVTTLHDNGNAVGRLGVGRDITERKRMERNLAELNDSLRLINRIMRHDILNDLTIINSSLELFKETRDERAIDTAFKAIERSVKLINQMRELEKLTAAKELRPCDVREVVTNVLSNYNVKYTVKGNCTALADEALASVIDNIVRNAVIHGKTDRVDVTVRRTNGSCEIRIADYGKGIPDEIKDNLFDEGFFYGDTGHTGLGLYIVRKVVERYGGEVWVEDNEPRGSVFVVRLNAS